MEPAVFKLKDLDFSNLKFNNPVKKTGKRFINIAYDKKPLYIGLPKLRVPYDSQVSNFNSLDINLSLDDRVDVLEKLQELDDKIVEFAEKNKWFGENKDFRYYPVVKTSEDYPASIKFKVTKKDGEIVTKFYDEKKEKVEVNEDKDVLDILKRNTKVISLVECVGIWFSEINKKESFGLFWRIDHMRVYPKSETNLGYMFKDSESEEDEDYMFED